MRDHAATRRSTQILVALSGLVLLLAACGTSASSAGSPRRSLQAPDDRKTVVMSGRSFGVAEITVPVGDVTFVNEDGTTHHVAEGEDGTEATDARITATRIPGGESAAVAFGAPGDYRITCLIHGSMNMVVHVE